MKHSAVEWIEPGVLSENPEIHSRNLFARRIADMGAEEIRQRYTYMSKAEFAAFVSFVADAFGVRFSGTGVELGAGIGVLSNTVASVGDGVEKIYAVEIVPEVVRLLQAKVTEDFGNQEKIVPVIGSFDELKLPDESVDFIVEFDSLHHSNDLVHTLREAQRVLKKGGFLLALDRVHFDGLTDEQRQYLLDIEYSVQFKEEYGLPLDEKFTRAQNGEHEIREREWAAAFRGAGLDLEKITFFHRKSLRGFLFGVISQVPYWARRLAKFQQSLSRFPLAFFGLYAPFRAKPGKVGRFASLDVEFSNPKIFTSKTAMLARKRR